MDAQVSEVDNMRDVRHHRLTTSNTLDIADSEIVCALSPSPVENSKGKLQPKR